MVPGSNPVAAIGKSPFFACRYIHYAAELGNFSENIVLVAPIASCYLVIATDISNVLRVLRNPHESMKSSIIILPPTLHQVQLLLRTASLCFIFVFRAASVDVHFVFRTALVIIMFSFRTASSFRRCLTAVFLFFFLCY